MGHPHDQLMCLTLGQCYTSCPPRCIPLLSQTDTNYSNSSDKIFSAIYWRQVTTNRQKVEEAAGNKVDRASLQWQLCKYNLYKSRLFFPSQKIHDRPIVQLKSQNGLNTSDELRQFVALLEEQDRERGDVGWVPNTGLGEVLQRGLELRAVGRDVRELSASDWMAHLALLLR
ncbi:hypothetical protein Q5P01_001046 [Channa striata]|uniref:Uncharacterized protein n=1 Tax=Channa striata TaxID=64152 RepID=A0AA88T4W6_CHASR|nr:hypothetical protein Q5P01_001046 [Channa striata]